MKKTFLTVALLLCFANGAFAAQAAITQIPALGASASIKDLRDATNTRLSATQSNFTEIYTALNGAPWLAQTTAPNIHNVFWIDTSGTSPTIKYWDGDSWEVAASGVDGTYTLPTASTETKGGVKIGARLTMTGDVLSADVQTTDISGKEDSLGNPSTNGYVLSSTIAGVRSWIEMTGGGTGIAHATSDGAYYASRNGAWASLAGVFATQLGSDDNYVTDAEKIKLGNLSGTNTGDQDLSGYALTSSVLSKTNTTAFTPTADYHPVPKKYVDDSITASGGYTDEQSQDAVGAMFSGNTETGITVTYDDATGKVNFVVPTTLAGFTDDSIHRVVTDTQISTWNAKQNALVAGTDYLAPTGSAANLTGFPSSLATDAEVAAGYQPLNADLTDLADGALTGSKVGTGIDGGNISIGTVADARIDAAIARDSEVTAAINALTPIVFGTGLTTAEDTPSVGTDTISVTANTYQSYDANMIAWPSTISSAEVGYLNGLTEAISTSLAGKQAAITFGTGVSTAIGNNTGTVGGLPTIIASGAYTVDTASIAANTCASAVPVTASGVATTDTIIATPNTIISSVAGFGVTTAGAVRVDVYPTDTDGGKVNFQFCNPTGAAIDPGSVTFNWKVIR